MWRNICITIFLEKRNNNNKHYNPIGIILVRMYRRYFLNGEPKGTIETSEEEEDKKIEGGGVTRREETTRNHEQQ